MVILRDNFTVQVIFLISLLMGFLATTGAGLQLNTISPANSTLVNSESFWINASVNDTDFSSGSINKTEYTLAQKGSTVKTGTFNASIDVGANNLDGPYNVTFNVTDNQSEVNTTLISFGVNGSDGGKQKGGEESSGLEIDDQKRSTRDLESPNIAFLGSSLNIQNANLSHTYNLTVGGIGGTVIKDNINATNPVKTSLSDPQGRATLYDENSSSNVSVDLVLNESDVVGRANTTNLNDLSLHYWMNGSMIQGSPQALSINNSWTNGESLYRMNVTDSLDPFWINFSTSKQDVFAGSRAARPFRPDVSMPRVNDVNVFKHVNVTGNVTEKGTNPLQPVGELKVRLRRIPSPENQYFSRFPYSTAPPKKYDFTNSSGNYKFTGLQALSKTKYTVDVVNRSHARNDHSNPMDGGFQVTPGQEKTENFKVNTSVGNVSVKLIGPDRNDTTYAFIIMPESGMAPSYMKPGVAPGKIHNISVPGGSAPLGKPYSVIAGKFVDTGGFFPSIQVEFGSTTVVDGQTSKTLDLGFPELVKLNGTVKSGGNPVKDAQVYAENESEGAFHVGSTDSNGEYELRVRNQTGYNLTVRPGFSSGLETKTKQITTSGDGTKDFSLSSGPYIEGYVTDASGGIGDVEIDVWNGTNDAFGSAETNASGYYKIGGLKENISYQMFVSPPPGYDQKQKNPYLNGSDGQNQTVDIKYVKETYRLKGNVTDSSGNNLAGKVTVTPEIGSRKTTSLSGGEYSFSSLDKGFYRVVVEPSNSSFPDRRKSVRLTSNTTLNFSISGTKTTTGFVNEQASGNGVSDVYVYAYNYSEESQDSDRTNSTGGYSIELANAGHKIEFYPGDDSNYEFKKSTISKSSVGTTGNDYTLTTGGFINGSVKDPGKINFSGTITVFNSTNGVSASTDFKGGSYNVTGLDDTIGYNIYLSVDNSSYAASSTTVNKSVSTKDFTLSPKKGPELWVTVNANSGGTVANATVILSGEEKKTNSAGVAKFGKQRDNSQKKNNPVTIRVYKDNYNSSAKTVYPKTNYTSGTGQTTSRNIQNESLVIENVQGKMKEVAVNVTDSSGSLVSDAVVVMRSTEKGSSLTTSGITASDGTVNLTQVLPGKKYLTSVSTNGNFNSKNITVKKGDKKVVDMGSEFNLGYEVPK